MAIASKRILPANHPMPPMREVISEPLSEYRERIADLRGYAAEDGFVPDAASENDFGRFVASTPGMRRAMLTLDENGCLTAHWENDAVGQVEIEFMGGGATEFVLIREPNEEWDAGRGDFSEAKERVKAFGLAELVGV